MFPFKLQQMPVVHEAVEERGDDHEVADVIGGLGDAWQCFGVVVQRLVVDTVRRVRGDAPLRAG